LLVGDLLDLVARESGESLDAHPVEQLTLAGGDVRDQAEVVVGFSAIAYDDPRLRGGLPYRY
jgi:hypothetical protein